MIKLAINGYGRIGRNILRALYEGHRQDQLKIVAINDLGDAKTNAHLTKYDSVHGKTAASIECSENTLKINHDTIQIFSERNPQNLPWGELDIDVVLECTGIFKSKEDCQSHLDAGAKKVIISAPGKNVDATIVYGVNHEILTPQMQVISNASCTTNCLAPLVKILNETIGIENGLMTTIHAYTNDQVLSDVSHEDLYRARAAALNMIPTKTGAAEAVSLVLPEMKNKLSGLAVRVPTANVSLIDLSFIAKKTTTPQEINDIIQDKAQHQPFNEILSVNHEPLVSSDFNHTPYSSTFDATQTRVQDRLIKIMAWYDNEWGFSNRMLDTAYIFSTR